MAVTPKTTHSAEDEAWLQSQDLIDFWSRFYAERATVKRVAAGLAQGPLVEEQPTPFIQVRNGKIFEEWLALEQAREAATGPRPTHQPDANRPGGSESGS